MCDGIINITNSVSGNVTNTVPANVISTLPKNSDYKKVRYKIDC